MVRMGCGVLYFCVNPNDHREDHGRGEAAFDRSLPGVSSLFSDVHVFVFRFS